jgi:L-ribulose-5-phosphate 3-epimerase
MSAPIGFMQGRLSPLVDGKIQAFPTAHWRAEFAAAEALGITLMEWTLDQDGLRDNPLMTSEGQAEIRDLSIRHGLSIPSVTGDCIMQAPFYKARGAMRTSLLDDLAAILGACGKLGIGFFVMPLVDDGGLKNPAEERSLFEGLTGLEGRMREHGVRIVFESDLEPDGLAAFIARLPADLYGINLDLGNSAALGFEIEAEVAAYGASIYNVHIKDRVLGGTTVPLGTGDADLPRAISHLAASGYQGNYILQTARSENGDHAGVLGRYRDMVAGWLGVTC